ncbi:hypothetical protein [Streptomyces cyaneofuscatus]|uniref:hypothetical protein n=1 Tax=Streptomyces cyaneofuscatus TaxID=66883 RepID=UPI00365E2C2D
MGTDDARRQYLHHEQFRAHQERAEHERVLEVPVAPPKVRRPGVRDLGGRGLTRERVLALGVRLLNLGFFRVGDQRYTQTNDSYGLTTVRRDQVTCSGGDGRGGAGARWRPASSMSTPAPCPAASSRRSMSAPYLALLGLAATVYCYKRLVRLTTQGTVLSRSTPATATLIRGMSI